MKKAEKDHAAGRAELVERAEAAEAERLFIDLELQNVKVERDAAEARIKELTEPPETTESSPVVRVPMGSVSDIDPSDLSQKLKAAQEEVRFVRSLQKCAYVYRYALAHAGMLAIALMHAIFNFCFFHY
jgi:hypothetical protein